MLFVIDVREEGPKGVKVATGVGVIFVVVTLRTADGRPQPNTGNISDPVSLIDRPVFLDLQPPFVTRLEQPVVGGGQHAVIGMLAGDGFNQVTRQLQQCESVEGLVLQKCRNHPIPVGR